MSLRFFAVATFLTFCFCSEEPNYPELNPEFESFQDMSKLDWVEKKNKHGVATIKNIRFPGFPLIERWHVMYRNYEEDPVFGTDKCIRFYQEESGTSGEYPIAFDKGPDTEPLNGKVMLEPSEGYTVTNRVLIFPEGQKDPLIAYTTYMDPDAKCGVTRSAYASDTACAVSVTESQLGKKLTSCDFVYNLLCGPDKFQIHDDSC